MFHSISYLDFKRRDDWTFMKIHYDQNRQHLKLFKCISLGITKFCHAKFLCIINIDRETLTKYQNT